MFLMALIFVLLLLLIFGVILLLTRQTAAERTIDVRIAKLQNSQKEIAVPGPEMAAIVKQNRLSQVPWVDALLQCWNFAHDLRLLIEQAESSWTVAGTLSSMLGLGVAGYGIGYCGLPGLWLPVPVAAFFAALPYLLLLYQRAQRLKNFNRYLPEAVDLMSRALRAGHSLTAAIEIVGEECPEPVRTEFREVYRQQNFGLPAREALLQLARRIPLPELNFVVTAMLLQKETGGNLVEVLDRTTAVIRERLRIEGEIRIYTAQGRLTGWILSLLPVAMFFLLSLANRSYTRVLIEDATGRRLVYTGLGLMLLGAMIIRKIVNVKI
jgi:tight adherence protein B